MKLFIFLLTSLGTVGNLLALTGELELSNVVAAFTFFLILTLQKPFSVALFGLDYKKVALLHGQIFHFHLVS